MKKIYKIVLTGGPCAGKTTLISRINQIFTLKGYRIFTVNEVATELINNGLRPFGDCVDLETFQDFVFDTSMFGDGDIQNDMTEDKTENDTEEDTDNDISDSESVNTENDSQNAGAHPQTSDSSNPFAAIIVFLTALAMFLGCVVYLGGFKKLKFKKN